MQTQCGIVCLIWINSAGQRSMLHTRSMIIVHVPFREELLGEPAFTFGGYRIPQPIPIGNRQKKRTSVAAGPPRSQLRRVRSADHVRRYGFAANPALLPLTSPPG